MPSIPIPKCGLGFFYTEEWISKKKTKNQLYMAQYICYVWSFSETNFDVISLKMFNNILLHVT